MGPGDDRLPDVRPEAPPPAIGQPGEPGEPGEPGTPLRGGTGGRGGVGGRGDVGGPGGPGGPGGGLYMPVPVGADVLTRALNVLLAGAIMAFVASGVWLGYLRPPPIGYAGSGTPYAPPLGPGIAEMPSSLMPGGLVALPLRLHVYKAALGQLVTTWRCGSVIYGRSSVPVGFVPETRRAIVEVIEVPVPLSVPPGRCRVIPTLILDRPPFAPDVVTMPPIELVVDGTPVAAAPPSAGR